MKFFFGVVFSVLFIASVPCKVQAQFALNITEATGNNYPTPLNYFLFPQPQPDSIIWQNWDKYRIWLRLDSICTPPVTPHPVGPPWKDWDLYRIWLKLDSCFSGSAGDSTLPGWALLGNAGTDTAIHKLGTIDNTALKIVTNDTPRVVIRTNGQIVITGVGLSTVLIDSTNSPLPINSPNWIINSLNSSTIPGGSLIGVPRSNLAIGFLAGHSLSLYALSNALGGIGSGMSIRGFAGADPYAVGGYENSMWGDYSLMFGDTVNGNAGIGTFVMQFSKTAANCFHGGMGSGRFNYNGIAETFAGAHSGANFLEITGGTRQFNNGFGGDVFRYLWNGAYSMVSGYGSARNFKNGNAICGHGSESLINAETGGNLTWSGYFNFNGFSNGRVNAQAFGSLLFQFLDRSNCGAMGFGNFSTTPAEDSLKPFLYWTNGDGSPNQHGRFNATLTINGGSPAAGRPYVSQNTDGFALWAVPSIDSTAGDAATQNAVSGRFRKDNSGTTFTVTNSFATLGSIITVTLGTTGVTAGNQITVLPQTGTFVVTFETAGVAAAPNKSVDIYWKIEN